MQRINMKKAALLLRCSTDSQDYDRQQRDLMPVADSFGYIVPEELIFGEYITGKDDVRKKDRESITKLKQACGDGKVDAIFINEVSRLSRDSIAGRLFIREFNEDYRVPIYFRDLSQWTINPDTRIINDSFVAMLGFYFDAAATELKSMKTRFASGKRKNARTGKSIGGVPSIGYTKDKDGTIIIDEENANLIRIIFTKYLEQTGTITSVGRYLRGISNVRNWGSGTVGNILRNKAYTGKMEVCITNPDEADESKRIEKFITTIPSIIDEDTFNKVQKKLDSNRSTQEYTRKEVHLLQKLIRCSVCGNLFSTKSVSSTKSFVYCCVSKQNGTNCNLSLSLDANKIEAIIWNLVKNKLLELNKLGESEKQERIEKEKHEIQSYEEEIAGIELGIEKLKRKKKNLIDFLEDAESEEEVADIKNRRRKYDMEISKSKEQIEQIKGKIDICKSNINQHLNSSITDSILSNIETDRNKMKAQIKEFVKEIIPYPIANSHSVLDVHTTLGRYYILYSSRDKDCQAYYLYGSYYKYYPLDNKFLVLGDFDAETVEKNMQVDKFSRTLSLMLTGTSNKEVTISSNNDENLSESIKKNNYYFVQKETNETTGVYTFDEMKEKCKGMNWILPFSI